MSQAQTCGGMPAHEPTPANRTPTGRFPPGVSGNPSGRPVDRAAQMLREILEANNGAELRKLCEVMITFAQSGDARAAEVVWNRAYRKPAMAQDDLDALTGAGTLDPVLAIYGIPRPGGH